VFQRPIESHADEALGLAEKGLAEARHLRRLPQLSSKVIHIDDPHRDERRRVEAFVEETYARVYGGRVHRHYSTLMSVQDRSGRIYAVVGFRLASEGALFLEQYLSEPVEGAIASSFGDDCPARATIAEIGNLASDGRGSTLFLFGALASHLRNLGGQYAVATATQELRGIFTKVGIDTVALGRADASRLPDGGRTWGSYYATDPVVLAGSIGRSLAPLTQSRVMGAHQPALRSRLHYTDIAKS
jgi:hypothetical protein